MAQGNVITYNWVSLLEGSDPTTTIHPTIRRILLTEWVLSFSLGRLDNKRRIYSFWRAADGHTNWETFIDHHPSPLASWNGGLRVYLFIPTLCHEERFLFNYWKAPRLYTGITINYPKQHFIWTTRSVYTSPINAAIRCGYILGWWVVRVSKKKYTR